MIENIPTKVLKDSSDAYVLPFNYMEFWNVIIEVFFEKNAVTWCYTGLHEKDPNLLENYWPVLFISMFLRFLRELFKNKSRAILMTFYHLLCGYEKSFSSQYALLSFIGKSKISLHKKEYARAVLMDLWKAFNTINYVLIIAKLHAWFL